MNSVIEKSCDPYDVAIKMDGRRLFNEPVEEMFARIVIPNSSGFTAHLK